MFTNATYSQREVKLWSGMDFSLRKGKRHRLKYMPLWNGVPCYRLYASTAVKLNLDSETTEA